MVCVVESNKEIKKGNWGYIGFEFLFPLHFFESEVWELIPVLTTWIFSSISSRSHLFACATLRMPTTPYTKVWSAHSRPPLMTCAFYTKTVIQNPLCRLMFTLCHCLDRNLLLRIRYAFKICLRHQSVTPILDPSLTVTDISSRNGYSYYW